MKTMTIKRLFLTCFGFIAIGAFVLSNTGPERYSAAVIRQGAEPGIRFSSGLTVTDEALRKGRWINRYWLSTGLIKPEYHLEQENSVMESLPTDAFELAIEGEDLARSWRWVKADGGHDFDGGGDRGNRGRRLRPVRERRDVAGV